MHSLICYLLFSLFMAWAAYWLVRARLTMILNGHGWGWVALAGSLAMGQWLVYRGLNGPLIAPIAVTVLYLLSLIGLAPDDTVLGPETSDQSLWFRRGLLSAVAGTVAGMGAWALLM